MPVSKSPTSQPQKIVLTTTSLRNVILANTSDVVYYEIITPRWARGTTTISRLDPNTRQYDIIGEMKNDDHGRAQEVRLYGGALRPAGDFLETVRKGPNGMKYASWQGKDGKRYTWRTNSRRLELIREDMPEDKPVAVYHHQKRYAYMLRMSSHPYLEIDSDAMDTLDTLIMSFLLMERRRRQGEV